jgi:hypothetical protein
MGLGLARQGIGLDALRSELGGLLVTPTTEELRRGDRQVFSTGLTLRGLDELLPEGGFPAGALVELSAVGAAGGATTVAAAALVAAQQVVARDAPSHLPGPLVAWITPERNLHGPALAALGLDLARCLVVVPPWEKLGRVAAKVVESSVFAAVIIDVHPLLAARSGVRRGARASVDDRALVHVGPPSLVTPPPANSLAAANGRALRRLAVAAEATGTLVLLRSDRFVPKGLPWPTALRLEIDGGAGELGWTVQVAKDRHGGTRGRGVVKPLANV